MLTPGQLIKDGKYRIVRLIGDGGMGSVYEAEHQVLGTRVALKFLHPEIANQRGLKERFLQEARVSASVISPHICRVSDVDTDHGGAYLVMELLQGEPLQAVIDREPRLDLGRAVDFSLQILAGLQVAHSRGVVHRDLKPDNVFLVPTAEGPQIKLLDFGIAKLRETAEFKMTLTRPGAVMGTPEYMAPEQAFSADLADPRSDLYSVGVLLFEMLAGRRPADGQNPQQIAEQILTGKTAHLGALRPDLPASFVQVVHRAIQGNPDLRWTSADEFSSALRPFSTEAQRPSLVHARPGQYHTGAATPFLAMTRTPVIGEYDPTAKAGDVAPRPAPPASEVPRTLPPDDGPPPSVMGASEARIITADMPAFQRPSATPSLTLGGYSGPQPAAPQQANNPARGSAAPGHSRPKTRGARRWVWVFAGLVLSCVAGAAGWLHFSGIASDADTPPLPTLRANHSPAGTDFELPDVPEGAPGRRAPPSPVRGAPQKPRPDDPGTKDPNPVFTLPTGLPSIPLPTAFPTALPTSFPFPVSPSPPPPGAPSNP